MFAEIPVDDANLLVMLTYLIVLLTPFFIRIVCTRVQIASRKYYVKFVSRLHLHEITEFELKNRYLTCTNFLVAMYTLGVLVYTI